jgi:hypothetical protein
VGGGDGEVHSYLTESSVRLQDGDLQLLLFLQESLFALDRYGTYIYLCGQNVEFVNVATGGTYNCRSGIRG